MGIILQQIIDVDEKNQVVDVNAYLKLAWNDYSMVWNPEDYDGITDLRFRKDQLWTPDVLLYNSADPHYDSSHPSNLVVYSNGLVNWLPPGVFRLTCAINIVYFPFDQQECKMKFGSWTFDGSLLDLDIDENAFDVDSYQPNGEWLLKNTSVIRNIQYYACCPEPYYDLVFTFIIRRRALYYAFNLILPCILITMLSLVGFTLPPDAGEKMSLQISIMLSICIFQNNVAEMSPPTSEAVPFLGVFFALCMFTCAGSAVATAMVLNFHHRNRRTHKMNSTMRKVMLNWLPWLLLMKRPGCVASHRKLIRRRKKQKDRIDICMVALLEDVRVSNSAESTRDDRRVQLPTDDIASPSQVAQLLVLQQIYTDLSAMNSRVENDDKDKTAEDDWKYTAIVMDRLALYILTFFIVVSTLFLFLMVPNIFECF